MIAMIAALAALAQTADASWTWTLYPDDDPVVLAHEAPDTANLRTVLECAPRSGVARISLYGGASGSGMARVTAGDASAMAQAEAGRDGTLKLALPIDHPAFAAFVAQGGLSVALDGQTRAVEVERAHLPKLRRFWELCSA